MIVSRTEWRWRVLGFGHVVHDCLESLAFEQGYRVKGVAEALGISDGYLREIFFRDVGLPVKEWMRWERMVVARRMLLWGMDPLVVADKLGFGSLSSFRREFSEVHGMKLSRYLVVRNQRVEGWALNVERCVLTPGAGRDVPLESGTTYH